MSLVLKIAGTDRTSLIKRDSIRKSDNLNDKTDSLEFELRKIKGLTPSLNSEVELYVDSTKVFGGVITRIEDVVEGLSVKYKVFCNDYSYLLGSKLANTSFTNKTAGSVIASLITSYAVNFTYSNVASGESIATISFDRQPLNEAINRVAELTGYSWYVDYDKDVHYFSVNNEAAPFNLTDDNGKYIWQSLVINKDLSQVRNRVIVRGGLEDSPTERTEQFTVPDVGESGRSIYRLGYKYKSISQVTVGTPSAVAQTVGVEFLDSDSDYNCMWSYQEKYIRFTSGNIPTANNLVQVTGTPLFPIIVQVSDNSSIAELSSAEFDGIFEHLIRDENIVSSDEAILRAEKELEAYAYEVTEGRFKTYEDGLRSGQTIQIASTARAISETFLIQSVEMRPEGDERIVYDVRLASLKTIGIIKVLQDLLRRRLKNELEGAILLTLVEIDDATDGQDNIDSISTTSASPGYYIWPSGTATGTTPAATVNLCTLA